MTKKLSIREVASNLNLSKTTVSFVLNGKSKEKRISEEVTQRVLQYLEAHNFKPNQLAKSLSTGKSMIIGLMVEKISDYFFAKIAYHIESLAYQSGYKLIYCSTDNDLQKTRELIQLFRDRQVDGYIITPPAGLEPEIQSLLDDDVPVVLFDRFFPAINVDYVVLDNLNSTYRAVRYLTDKGYKHIGYVELASDQTQMHDRNAGYRKALKEATLPPYTRQIPFNHPPDATVEEIKTLIQENPQMDALFFATNYLAMSGLKAITSLGLKTPEDVALIAFDDHDVFDVYSPTISAVAQPVEEMATQLVDLLLNKMNGGKRLITQVVLPAKLIERESTTQLLERKRTLPVLN